MRSTQAEQKIIIQAARFEGIFVVEGFSNWKIEKVLGRYQQIQV